MTRRALLAPLLVAAFTLALHGRAPAADDPALPPDEAGAKAALEKSPRHGEWAALKVTVPGAPAPAPVTVQAYVVYPERKDKAPVVVVISEIYGLSDWLRGVADRLAADGFIAVAPDLLSGRGPRGGGTDTFASRDDVVKAIRDLSPEFVLAGLDAAREYGAKIPAANGKVAALGFCWGGGQSFSWAVAQPSLAAAVVYYGTGPDAKTDLSKMKAPVLGFYGGDDARVNSTIDASKEAVAKAGRSYEAVVYDGAGHGFLRQQTGRDGANMKAARQAWPKTLEFLRSRTK
jgi:carboxymethylenebutenolidase